MKTTPKPTICLGIDDPGVHSCDGCCREESDHA